jgi:hypothetical protein
LKFRVIFKTYGSAEPTPEPFNNQPFKTQPTAGAALTATLTPETYMTVPVALVEPEPTTPTSKPHSEATATAPTTKSKPTLDNCGTLDDTESVNVTSTTSSGFKTIPE